MTEFFQNTAFLFSMIWLYIFLSIAALWYWVKRSLFQGRKRWFLLAVFLSLLLCFCIDERLVEEFYLTIPFLTPFMLFVLGKLRGIAFTRAEYLVGAVLSVPCATVTFALLVSLMVKIYGV